jgi:hypothetical protein
MGPQDRDIEMWNEDYPAIRKELLARRHAQYDKAYADQATLARPAEWPSIPEE